MHCGSLYDQAELMMVTSNDSLTHDWRVNSFRQFCNTIQNLDFPCLFGKKAFASVQCKILFVANKDKHIVINDLLEGFLKYTEFVKTTDMNERLLFPMIVFLQCPYNSLKKQHEQAWKALQLLHDADPLDWPLHMQRDPEHHDWSFCFNNVPLFINISAPSHLLMRTRNLSESIVFVVNPRENFDKVASLDEISGRKIRQRIRERVCKYNNGFMPKSLGFFGEENNLEWKQYQLYEPNALDLKKCPLHIKKK